MFDGDGAVPGNAVLVFGRPAAGRACRRPRSDGPVLAKAMVGRPYRPSHRIRKLPSAYGRLYVRQPDAALTPPSSVKGDGAKFRPGPPTRSVVHRNPRLPVHLGFVLGVGRREHKGDIPQPQNEPLDLVLGRVVARRGRAELRPPCTGRSGPRSSPARCFVGRTVQPSGSSSGAVV